MKYDEFLSEYVGKGMDAYKCKKKNPSDLISVWMALQKNGTQCAFRLMFEKLFPDTPEVKRYLSEVIEQEINQIAQTDVSEGLNDKSVRGEK